MKTMITAVAAFILSFQGAVAAQQSATPEDESQGIPATSHQEEVAREIEPAPEEEIAQAETQGETEEEMPASPHQKQAVEGELLGQLDTDGDGLISQQEAEADTRLADTWDQYDENADGMLDAQELDRFEQELSDTEEAE